MLAPKLVQKAGLVDSQIQHDAVQVLQWLVGGSLDEADEARPMGTGVMPLLDSSSCLKQDIIYMLGRYLPSIAAHYKPQKPSTQMGPNRQGAGPHRAGLLVGQAPQ